jgi:hypothetical protein
MIKGVYFMLLDKQRVKNVRDLLGLTDEAKFCGFVIHIPEKDEFIAKIQEYKFGKIIGYAPLPDYAIKYRRMTKQLKQQKNVTNI